MSDSLVEYLDFFFTLGGKIEKLHGGTLPGPRDSAPAPVRRFTPFSGLRSILWVWLCAPVWFFNFTTHREKKSRYQQKSPRYQANPRYQPKKRRYLYSILCFQWTCCTVTVCQWFLFDGTCSCWEPECNCTRYTIFRRFSDFWILRPALPRSKDNVERSST